MFAQYKKVALGRWLAMYASAASRCASSVLNSRSNPSFVLLRVYIAQRTWDFLLAQAKEVIAVPVTACDLLGQRGQATKMLSLVLEPLLEHFDLKSFSLVPAHQQRPRHGQAPIAGRMIRSRSRFASRTSARSWRGKPQVTVPGQFGGPPAGPLAKIRTVALSDLGTLDSL